MPLYVTDYLADTGHLSTLEHGAYLLLIMHYWMQGAIPDDDYRLAKIARVGPKTWEQIRPTLAGLFHDGWKHKRIEAEISRVKDIAGKRRLAGMAGASVRYGKNLANAKQTHTQSQSQSHTQEEIDSACLLFEKFTNEYPFSPIESRAKAFDAFLDLNPESRVSAVNAVAPFKAWLKKQKDYPHLNAATFLSERRFEGFANDPSLSPEEIQARRDKADRLLNRGKYAESEAA